MQMVTDISLPQRGALRQRETCDFVVHIRGGVEAELYHTDLRAVSVAYDDFVALFYQANQRGCGFINPAALFLRVVAEGVAAQCNYYSCHTVSTSFHRRTCHRAAAE